MTTTSEIYLFFAKYRKIFLLAAALSCVFILNSCAAKESGHPLEEAFVSMDIEVEEMRIVIWKCLAEEYLVAEEMRNIINSTVQLLNAEIISVAVQDQEEYSSCTMLAKTEFAEYSLMAQSMPAESYMIIMAEIDAKQQDFSEAEAILVNALGGTYSLNAFLSGSCVGNMQGKWKKQLTKAAADCGAAVIEQAETEAYYSISAYCPILPEFVMSAGEAVNLQLAASYDEQAGRSFYYLGYPLLYNDY